SDARRNVAHEVRRYTNTVLHKHNIAPDSRLSFHHHRLWAFPIQLFSPPFLDSRLCFQLNEPNELYQPNEPN
ncbi:hypothetical protein KAX14_03600, partial [Candidatus Bipolaricaulota bacterium]|nr:hypothetical protein [Candidatus Bipolaricaulota bacterium]